jgi:ketosteroid isomerase-like protein
MRNTFAAVFAALLATFALPQQIIAADPAEVQLTKIEHNWAESYVKRDPSFVKRLATDNFIFIGPDGAVMNKEDYVKEMTGDTVFSAFNVVELKIRTYGNVGVVTGKAAIAAKMKETDLSGDYAFTDVFVKQGGEWKAVSGQATLIKPAQPAR